MNYQQVPEKQAKEVLGAAPEEKVSDLEAAVPKFKRIKLFTTFEVEYAVIDNDLVYHFYVTPEVNALPDPRQYWLKDFMEVINELAQSFFHVGPDRLAATYVEEVASWWMRASGFGSIGDPDMLSERFFEVLDQALEKKKATPA